MAVSALVLHKISLLGCEPIERVKRLVHAALIGFDRGDLFGQRYDTVAELRDCRYVGRCRRTAQVRRKSLGFARRPAEEKPTPVGFGQATRRFVEEYLVQYDRTADVQAQFAVRETDFAPPATIENRL